MPHFKRELDVIHRTNRILHPCARIVQLPEHHHLLFDACCNFTRWNTLLQLAENQGMGPLLHKHITTSRIDIPPPFARSLRILSLRHRQTNAILLSKLTCILHLFKREGIPCLILKGAALCQILYPQPYLRPMRDIDLLLSETDVYHAHDLLKKEGFVISNTPIPFDHFHLQPLYKKVDGLQICVELHHGLYAQAPPFNESPPFSILYRKAISFDNGGIEAFTLNTAEMLSHLYHHGFRAPLTYEPYRLISVADIVGLVEKEVNSLNWEKLQSQYPNLFNTLQYFHHITPWTKDVLEKISTKPGRVPTGVGISFMGWPQIRLSDWRGKKRLTMLRLTFFPSQWWLRIYYSNISRLPITHHQLLYHWRQLFWWAKLYWFVFCEENLHNAAKKHQNQEGSLLLSLEKVKVLTIAIIRKFRGN